MNDSFSWTPEALSEWITEIERLINEMRGRPWDSRRNTLRARLQNELQHKRQLLAGMTAD
ncbi:MAG: hypothetical protein DRQ37_06165 [Gammaproteobacteria bacterium]|nr:MAG: hypothetical protein DRQ37_06165 [Gammaproteobacteria bacterium]